jgi:hypothetical protein
LTAISRTSARTAFVLLLALYAGALLWQAWHLSLTFDEPSHLAASYTYWRGHDVLRPSDTPPLMRIVSGWIPLLLHAPLRQDTEAWRSQSSFDIGTEIIEGSGAAGAHRLAFLMRLPFLAFPVLTVWLVWRWARQIFSEGTALAVALGVVLEPTLLGHGALIKSDWPATFGCVLFFYAAWRYWPHPGWKSLWGMILALLVAILTKFTMLALIPVALLLVLWRGPRLAGAAVTLAVVYVGLLAAYQFRIRPVSRQEIQEMESESLSGLELRAARILRRLPWPPQFIAGLRFIGHADRSEIFAGYMLGRRIETSAPGYFPFAWAVKFPIGLQLLSLAGLAVLALRLARREAGAADAFVWGPAALIMLLGIRSHIHIGIRHVLPALPFFVLGAGFAIERLVRRRAGQIAVAVCLAWLAGASAWIYPNGISYFNEWVGGPRTGWKYLSDSNIDWGQNLPELARYVAENNLPSIKLFYFGSDIPWHYVPSEKIVQQAAPWGPEWEKETRFQPAPGVYAISVNTWLGYFFRPPYRDYFAAFKAREPDARIAYSIFIYNVK